MSDEVEAVVRRVLRSRYSSRQRRSVAVICREIDRECKMAGRVQMDHAAVAVTRAV
ncbi:hypothetical protein ACFXO9_14945 [Nocardia tengchongensis]|uniref:hypothetical protein n=1 Tax=Nocardia tengchongensis TaxID=2055889 RepID=UPI0036B09E78